MKKYTCKAKKYEIVNAIIDQFEKVNAEYTESLKNDDLIQQERKFGKYIAMVELLNKLQIYDVCDD